MYDVDITKPAMY